MNKKSNPARHACFMVGFWDGNTKPCVYPFRRFHRALFLLFLAASLAVSG